MRRGVIQLVLGLVALSAALVLNAWVVGRDRQLQRDGATRPGEVIELDRNEDGTYVHVTYRYAGREREMSIYVSEEDEQQYALGEDVTVVIDRDDPDRVTLRGRSNQRGAPNLLIVLGVLGGAFHAFIGLVTCIYHLARRALPTAA